MQAVVSSSRSSTLKSLLISSSTRYNKSLLISSSTRVLEQPSPPPSVSSLPWQMMNHKCLLSSSSLTTTTYYRTARCHHHPILYMWCSYKGMNMSSSNTGGGCCTEEGKEEEGEIQPEPGILLCFTYRRTETHLYHLQIKQHHDIHNGVLVKYPLEFDGMSSDFRLVGSCNGLICVTGSHDTYFEPMFICNPITAENIQFPEPQCGYGYENGNKHTYNVRSGFVLATIPFLNSTRSKELCVIIINLICNWNIEILTLGLDAEWRMLGNVPYCLDAFVTIDKIYFSPLCFNGAIHWFGCEHIVAFDVAEEKFRTFQFPPISMHVPFPPIETTIPFCQLFELGGYLCLSHMLPDRYEIWVMKEYGVRSSWTKEYEIPKATTEGRLFGPLMLLKNGNIVLLRRESIVFYDPTKNNSEKLQVRNITKLEQVRDYWLAAVPHVSSFISPNNV